MNLGKKVTLGEEARKKLIEGINDLANAVKVTLGPKGKTVVIEKDDLPHVTKDGVSVAKSIRFSDREKNLGAKLIREVSEKAAADAGDGTTTSCVLTQALVIEGNKLVSGDVNPNNLKRGIDIAVEKVVSFIEENSIKIENIEDLENIAKISANGDIEISNLLKEAFNTVGLDGTVVLEKSKTNKSFIEVTKGLELAKGWLSKYFINDSENSKCVFENAVILLVGKRITEINCIISILSYCVQEKKPLVIVADDISDSILTHIIANKSKGLQCLCVKNPGFGEKKEEILEDLSIMTGASPILESKGRSLESITVKDLGVVSKVSATMNNSIFEANENQKDIIEKHCSNLKKILENSDNEYVKANMRNRIASLTSGLATIRIGCPSEVEAREKMDRADDALCAIKSALKEGYSIGGGITFLRASRVLDKFDTGNNEKNLGVKLVRRALKAPITQILKNAGEEPEEIITDILANDNFNFGYNAYTEKFSDLKKDGVIDATKVIRCALQDSASVAGLILTTDCIITNELELNELSSEL